ncbi:hypothetical protein BHE74_00007457 [Ensete ventricosum]|nr:hypothetical protein GW17_00024266 [Ensete ventricosum]RWW83984.1 hypothetical protein BHE74_00007457 [Ensete ventricosum]RZS07732.1 hypothetical protein BHM03_00038612 [Ensete ventricosum]
MVSQRSRLSTGRWEGGWGSRKQHQEPPMEEEEPPPERRSGVPSPRGGRSQGGGVIVARLGTRGQWEMRMRRP